MIAKWWNSRSIQLKLMLLVQLSLLVVLIVAQGWVMSHVEEKIMDSAKDRASEVADGIINGMNMLMISGRSGDPHLRSLFIEKMGQSQGIKELRIFRAEQVKRQFGIGLPEEQPQDAIDQSVLDTGKPHFERSVKDGVQTLRAVIPFIASRNFKGTDCLQCHNVEVGSVNGAASVVLDLTAESQMIKQIDQGLWIGQLGIQVVLYIVVSLMIGSFTRPVARLQTMMTAMQQDGDLSRRIDIKTDDEIGRMAQAFNAMSDSLQRTVDQVKQSKEQLKLLAQVFVNSAEAIVITDADNNIIQVNKAFTEITGFAPEEVYGKNPRILKSDQQDADFYREMWDTLLTKGNWQGEIMDRRKNGEVYPKWISISIVRNDKNEISNYIALFSDITERRATFERIQNLAHYDALTQLPNRVLLQDHIEFSLANARRAHAQLAVIFMDLDRFKPVNDELGHHVGDLLLQSVAKRLKMCVRESDTVSRLGGDEFVILLNNIHDRHDVEVVAQKIIDQLGQPFQIAEHSIQIGSSLGVSLFPEHGTDQAMLIKQADAAMYLAKEKGRNNYQFFPSA